jgi:hypothetical protein
MASLKNILTYSFFMIQLYSCISENNETTSQTNWKIENSNIKIDKAIHFKKISLQLPEYNTSGNNNIFIIDSNFIIYDNLFHTATMISNEGKILIQNGGLEKSMDYSRFTLPYSFLQYHDGYVSVFGRKLSVLQNNFEIKEIKKLDFVGKENLSSMLAIPNANNMTVYELNERNKNSFQISDDEIVVSIESEAPSFNPYNTLLYFKKARPFGIINISNATISPMPITRSSMYKDSCCLTVQDASYFVKKDSLYYIQFAADSLMYVYNKDFIQKYAFGNSGKFLQNKIYNDGLDIAFDQEKYLTLEKRANSIEALFIFKKEFISRIINNNSNKEKYLQIYKGVNLIYEKEIPFNFKYLGTYNNSIVGIINENDNQKKICILKQY